jgi:hypothetical protein
VKEIAAMPNPVEEHLSYLRSLSGVAYTPKSDAPVEVPIPPRADAGRVVSRKDNGGVPGETSATPVVGGEGTAALKQALDKGLREGDGRRR